MDEVGNSAEPCAVREAKLAAGCQLAELLTRSLVFCAEDVTRGCGGFGLKALHLSCVNE